VHSYTNQTNDDGRRFKFWYPHRPTHIDKKFSVNQYFLHVIINGVSYKSAITTYGLACTIIVYPFPLNAL